MREGDERGWIDFYLVIWRARPLGLIKDLQIRHIEGFNACFLDSLMRSLKSAFLRN